MKTVVSKKRVQSKRQRLILLELYKSGISVLEGSHYAFKNLKCATPAKSVTALERKGLIHRSPGAGLTRKTVLISLTDAGKHRGG